MKLKFFGCRSWIVGVTSNNSLRSRITINLGAASQLCLEQEMTTDPEAQQATVLADQQPETLLQRKRAKRLPAAERKAVILREASLFFAQEGFSASTRDLADRLGVRQALLYKYFPSKEALLEAIFENVLAVHWVMEWAGVFADASLSTEQKLLHFYSEHLKNEDGIGLRLFLRAALDGWPLSARRMELVRAKMVRPLIAEMRREAKLPDYDAAPLMWGELELVMTLHASVIFYSMRVHIYEGDMPPDTGDVLRLYIANFLSGARETLLRLHGPEAPASLRLPVGPVKSAA